MDDIDFYDFLEEGEASAEDNNDNQEMLSPQMVRMLDIVDLLWAGTQQRSHMVLFWRFQNNKDHKGEMFAIWSRCRIYLH